MKTINIALSPNTSRQDSLLALRLLAAPGRWGYTGEKTRMLEGAVSSEIGVAHAFALDSGRSGLYLALKAMGIGAGDEVLVQAYTCIAVPNSVVWAGAKPIYADIDAATLNVDLKSLEAKITPKTKAIVVQHTFGRPGPVQEIVQLARARGIRVIEDCAHALGASTASGSVGSFGDAAIFSFGRDKVISSVSGGMVTTADPDLARHLARLRDALPLPGARWTFNQLFHPVASSGILRTYDLAKLGKALLVGLQKTGLLDLAVRPEERRGQMPKGIPTRLPDVVAQMALSQFARLGAFNTRRRTLAALYDETLAGTGIQLPPTDQQISKSANQQSTISNQQSIYLRYTLHVPNPAHLHRAARAQNIYLGNWYDTVIAPADSNLAAIAYTPGECPVAEQQAATSINLPTHPKVTLEDGARVAEIVRKWDTESVT
ncbi:MAG: aminotransferase class I/II-fold pyridoxal phosphate-dependent enzyme [Anaerolineales bacterium]|nr:aminotransferase class I/II-fold pyridoxal phosphate-dependent enzyme [Anaerolineales bacterium]